ncbi:hypothetical protein CDD83_1216 [Cordyceps sp. RAO-2017]|nr:hypothetical protein CDD83_1216 [Cordyceps sp. RAO-2017]
MLTDELLCGPPPTVYASSLPDPAPGGTNYREDPSRFPALHRPLHPRGIFHLRERLPSFQRQPNEFSRQMDALMISLSSEICGLKETSESTLHDDENDIAERSGRRRSLEIVELASPAQMHASADYPSSSSDARDKPSMTASDDKQLGGISLALSMSWFRGSHLSSANPPRHCKRDVNFDGKAKVSVFWASRALREAIVGSLLYGTPVDDTDYRYSAAWSTGKAHDAIVNGRTIWTLDTDDSEARIDKLGAALAARLQTRPGPGAWFGDEDGDEGTWTTVGDDAETDRDTDFAQDAAHQYWKWDQKCQNWWHVDEETKAEVWAPLEFD